MNIIRDRPGAWLAVATVMTAAWLMLVPPVLSAVIPGSWWIDVRRMDVSDTVEGVPPTISVDRTVRRSFIGTWQATIRQEVGTGFVPFCRRKSPAAFRYILDGQIGPDLRWWLEIPPNPDCPWLPGRYLVETTWQVHYLRMFVFETSITSNVFTIHAEGELP